MVYDDEPVHGVYVAGSEPLLNEFYGKFGPEGYVALDAEHLEPCSHGQARELVFFDDQYLPAGAPCFLQLAECCCAFISKVVA